MSQKRWMGSWKVTYIRLASVKIHSIAAVKIDDSNFKVVMQLNTGMLKLGLFQVGFFEPCFREEREQICPYSIFWLETTESMYFARSKFNLITIELSQKRLLASASFKWRHHL